MCCTRCCKNIYHQTNYYTSNFHKPLQRNHIFPLFYFFVLFSNFYIILLTIKYISRYIKSKSYTFISLFPLFPFIFFLLFLFKIWYH
ncbi:MAG TPA: hypothetical protein DDY85_00750 [Fusobacterium sp.]|nr:hypothetical protein DXD66_09775 [Fusobacterium varium]HBJ77543.1 hypothetical protein [Fusobacterium sp.]